MIRDVEFERSRTPGERLSVFLAAFVVFGEDGKETEAGGWWTEWLGSTTLGSLKSRQESITTKQCFRRAVENVVDKALE